MMFAPFWAYVMTAVARDAFLLAMEQAYANEMYRLAMESWHAPVRR
jgi:hypothetical protein